MMLPKITLILFFSLILGCNTSNKTPSTLKTDSCFSTENFENVKSQIDFRISVSGMGKYYVTFPAEKGKSNDGIKRLPQNSGQVYDCYFDDTAELLVFKSPKHHFKYHGTEGLVDKEEVDHQLAERLFCYLLALSK